ncbi:polysaccharide deacetylase [Paenibacillus ehimensis]|uniref:polysaccharide deacetylase n=1 Tax=Paenibacillus ehimensis TaxID=79264 RepID=UPI0004723E89|nr:polysaccharide deacetylase [Paenibacillus ehimensis]MEC0208943.1 polysaccharide deacetylase family protein [Paenibacillus ehimensis]
MKCRPQANSFRMISTVWTSMLCLTILWLTVLTHTAGAAPGHEGEEALFAQLKSGKRIAIENNYTPAEKPTVYLTFDDGPSKLTPKVLDILREEDVRATFFVLGEQVQERPNIAKRIVEEGHALGNHTYNHVYRELYSDFRAFWEQVQKTENILLETTGVRPRFIRAPGGTSGNFDAFYFYYLGQAGYEIYDWSIDSEDARRPGMTADRIVRTVEKGPFGKEVIVLMHDGSGHDETVKALPRIIKLFKEKGYAFASLTPEVKPVQFSGGKPKWTRTVNRESFDHLLAAAQEHRRLWSAQVVPAKDNAPQTLPVSPTAIAYTEAGSRGGPDRLNVHLGDRTLALTKEQFRFRAGSCMVPLRRLITEMGGTVEWNAERRTAVVRYGAITAVYDLARQELRVRRPAAEWAAEAKARIYPFPEMELANGTLYVPLRQTLELLGDRMLSGAIPQERGTAEVQAAVYGGYRTGWMHMRKPLA